MFLSLIREGGSPSFLNKKARGLAVQAALALILSACSEGFLMDNCAYLDAFEQDAELEEFTASKGRLDALEMISQGRIVLVGGYLATSGVALPLREFAGAYPVDELEKIAIKYGLDKIEKVYLTKKLNSIKSGNILRSEDGVVDGRQVERECYNSDVRSYAIEFNKIIIGNYSN